MPHPTPLTRPQPWWPVCARVKTHGAPAPDQRLTLSASRRASHRKTLSRKAFYRKTLDRKTLFRRTPKITIIAAGSALALAGIAAGTVAAWPGDHPRSELTLPPAPIARQTGL